MVLGASLPGDADSTLVGRDDHMRRLRRLLDQTALGRPDVLLVFGEVGVGKSRLLRELVTVAQKFGSWTLWGSCIEMGSGELPYAPLIEAMRRLTRAAGNDDVATLAGPAFGELNRLVADFAGPATSVGAGGQAQVFGAVLRMLDHLGTDRPVVFVMEDLQWADSSTLDLFTYLARMRTDERLLLIGSYRNDLPPRHPLRMRLAELDGQRLTDRMEVNRFTRSDLREFLRADVSEPVTHDLVESIFELTDGNPLFVEEVVATGLPTVTSGGDGAISLPDRLRGILLPRFEQLSDDAQQVMGVAATAGRRVSHRLLETVCEMPRERMKAALRECVASQMLVTDPADETYAFRQALMREVVHEALIPGDRLDLHRAIAAALEANSDLSYAAHLTVAAELSYHWNAAQEYPEALKAAVRAGHDAMSMLAFREAGRQFDRALQIWTRLPDAEKIAGMPKHRLLSVAADAARWAGRTARAVSLAQNAVSLLDAMLKPVEAGEAYERLGSYLWELGDHGSAERAYADAAELLDGQPPSAAAARVLAVSATAQIRKGHTADGLQLGRQALELARAVGAKAEEGRAHNTIGTALCLLGRVDTGAAELRRAVHIADGLGRLEDLFRAYGNLVFALEHSGAPEEAAAVAAEGLARARETGLEHTRGRGVLANNFSAALLMLGQWDEATLIIEQLLQDLPPAQRLFPGLTLAEIAVARGEFDRARTLLSVAREAGGSVEQPQFLGSMYASLAEIELWQHEHGAARTAVEGGLQAVAGTDNLVVRLRLCALGLRNEADAEQQRKTQRANARRRSGDPSSVLGDLLAHLDGLPDRQDGHPALPEVDVLRLLCRAEAQRAQGSTTPAAWTEVAAGWAALKRPYQLAYARWREAEAHAVATRRAGRVRADQERIGLAAYEAHRLATELGADPLRRAVEDLARGVNVGVVSVPTPRSAPDNQPTVDVFNLTRREREVLALLTAGWSNKKIGKKLFISPGTAGVHVSNILRKLNVPSRSEAAAVANELGLVDGDEDR
jgi:DNA-binding CsgD family transcriptional regulator/tetratricopeptide (TPR) repeat protein